MDSRHDVRTTGSMRARLLVLACAVALLAAAELFLASGGIAAGAECQERGVPDPDCGTHNMMVVGQRAIYLSHLPMFDNEHRFQVILEATLAKSGKSLSTVYLDDRRGHADVKMYTLEPQELFVLARLFGTDGTPRRSFRGTMFRGHLERGGVRVARLNDVEVTVKRVIYAQEIGSKAGIARSDALDYILFGDGTEMFLAHRIAEAPDFDQLLGVKISGHSFTADDLKRGVSITVPDRQNTADRRLRAKDKIAAQGKVTGAAAALPLTVEVTTEFYFEEGELASPATFGQTPLEKSAGF
jgi:hypothetical protein